MTDFARFDHRQTIIKPTKRFSVVLTNIDPRQPIWIRHTNDRFKARGLFLQVWRTQAHVGYGEWELALFEHGPETQVVTGCAPPEDGGYVYAVTFPSSKVLQQANYSMPWSSRRTPHYEESSV